VQVGGILAGKYRIDRVLGKGGMGVVVQAMHLQLGQSVAVKFLLPEVLHNRDVVQRFLREAQAAVRLRSEHVARVIDVGTLETGAPYMVLEYLDGNDLAHVPPTHLNPGVIVDLMLQACEALAEAHSLGIVHRDIKPANFFITRRPDGSPLLKILDFGISKAPVAHDSGLTGTQVVMGTPAYMSPEQMKSARDVDHRSDIWSVGIVLYQLLEGAAPFEAETFTSLCIKVATEALRPMTKKLPAGLTQVVYRCLEKDPARRFADVHQLARALAPFARSQTQAAISLERTAHVFRGGGRGGGADATMPATMAETAAPAVPTTLGGSAIAIATQPTPGPRKLWPFAIGGTVVLGGIVTFAIVASSGGAAPTAAPTPAAAPTTTAPTAPPTPAPSPTAATAPTATATAPTGATMPPAVATTPAPPPAATPAPTEKPAPVAATTTKPPRPSTKKPKATAQATKPTTTESAKPPATQTVKPPATAPAGNDDILGTRN